jgi:hypothetical protein
MNSKKLVSHVYFFYRQSTLFTNFGDYLDRRHDFDDFIAVFCSYFWRKQSDCSDLRKYEDQSLPVPALKLDWFIFWSRNVLTLPWSTFKLSDRSYHPPDLPAMMWTISGFPIIGKHIRWAFPLPTPQPGYHWLKPVHTEWTTHCVDRSAMSSTQCVVSLSGTSSGYSTTLKPASWLWSEERNRHNATLCKHLRRIATAGHDRLIEQEIVKVIAQQLVSWKDFPDRGLEMRRRSLSQSIA